MAAEVSGDINRRVSSRRATASTLQACFACTTCAAMNASILHQHPIAKTIRDGLECPLTSRAALPSHLTPLAEVAYGRWHACEFPGTCTDTSASIRCPSACSGPSPIIHNVRRSTCTTFSSSYRQYGRAAQQQQRMYMLSADAQYFNVDWTHMLLLPLCYAFCGKLHYILSKLCRDSSYPVLHPGAKPMQNM